MLGTTCATVRSLALRGDLEYQTTLVRDRMRWKISRESTEAWLASNGRIDERRLARRLRRSTADSDLAQQLARVMRDNEHLQAERDRLVNEVATLRAVTLQLRARNDASVAAEAHQAEANQHLLDAAQAQARAADALRRGLAAQDDALGQFLIPGPAGFTG